MVGLKLITRDKIQPAQCEYLLQLDTANNTQYNAYFRYIVRVMYHGIRQCDHDQVQPRCEAVHQPVPLGRYQVGGGHDMLQNSLNIHVTSEHEHRVT